MQALRENEVRPLRLRGDDLVAKLETVRSQLASTRTMRERSLSTTSLDMRDKSKLDLSLASRGRRVRESSTGSSNQQF